MIFQVELEFLKEEAEKDKASFNLTKTKESYLVGKEEGKTADEDDIYLPLYLLLILCG